MGAPVQHLWLGPLGSDRHCKGIQSGRSTLAWAEQPLAVAL